jgi:hypothetical protein
MKSAKSNLQKAIDIAESENDIALLSQLRYIEMPTVLKLLKRNIAELSKLQNRRMIKKQEVGTEEIAKVASL